jgi:hypothetical protein
LAALSAISELKVASSEREFDRIPYRHWTANVARGA